MVWAVKQPLVLDGQEIYVGEPGNVVRAIGGRIDDLGDNGHDGIRDQVSRATGAALAYPQPAVGIPFSLRKRSNGYT
jgi:hypothetical protein